MTRTLISAASAPLLVAVATLHAADSPATRLPETTSTGFGSALSENAPIGETGRPEWTSARRFPGTRVYIQQEPWEVGIESWWRVKRHRDGTTSNRLLEEIEIGLPYRMQLDVYGDIEGDEHKRFHYQSTNVELRFALANWGKIPGNPTLYAEYKFADEDWGSDVYEFKVLLGDSFLQRFHWGVNFVWEAEMEGEREHEFQITGGLSYTILDKRVGLGVEFLYDHSTVKDGRGDPSQSFNIGPSVQIRLTDHMHLDLSYMFGCNRDSDEGIGFIVVGYDFGGPTGHAKREYTPTSGRHN